MIICGNPESNFRVKSAGSMQSGNSSVIPLCAGALLPYSATLPMEAEMLLWRSLAAILSVAAAGACTSPTSRNVGVDRLYVMDCGHNAALDQSRWSPGIDAGKPIELSDNCYLIQHGSQWLLWDTGYPDALADKIALGQLA